jgi:sensor histidine kinase YesM
MKEPDFLSIVLLVAVCLVCAVIGLYLLANFNRLFRGTIKNEALRKNAAAWLVICFISVASTPLGGSFYSILHQKGWLGMLSMHLISTTAFTILVYNTTRIVAENERLRKLSFTKHKLLVVFTLVLTVVAVNLPITYILYNFETKYLRFSLISSIYLGAATGMVYALLSWQDIERKRKIDEKELELSKLRELKSKAELDALHSKVNPHFLYNALNSIADLSITDGKKARRMTVALADLFRYSINYSDNNFSTLKEELEMAEVYLLIEKIRFEDKLNYSVSVDEELNHYLVPRFLLQPLVENAVKHGLKATGQLTEITLQVRREGEGMVIEVADTGPVFPEYLNPGYGVKSVYDKLELLFPKKFDLSFNNQPRKHVSIKIHKLVKDEQNL